MNISNTDSNWLSKAQASVDNIPVTTLNMALESAKQYLQQQYASKVSLNQKGNIAIGILVTAFGIIVPLLASLINKKDCISYTAIFIGILAFLSLIIAYCYFSNLLKARKTFHAGLFPDESIPIDYIQKIVDDPGGSSSPKSANQLKRTIHSAISINILDLYQRRIEANQIENFKMAQCFNKGIFAASGASFLLAIAIIVAGAPCNSSV